MSIGVIFSNKPIKGSCGGLQSLGLKGKCDICGETKSSNDHKKSDDIFSQNLTFYIDNQFIQNFNEYNHGFSAKELYWKE